MPISHVFKQYRIQNQMELDVIYIDFEKLLLEVERARASVPLAGDANGPSECS